MRVRERANLVGQLRLPYDADAMKPGEVFQSLRGAGCSPLSACRVASKLGLNKLEKLTGLRQVYALSLIEAKNVLLRESGTAENVDENQAQIAKVLLDVNPDELRRFLEGEG